MLEGPLVTAATVVMVAAVASRRTVPKSDENATNLLCCARLKRQFFTAYLLFVRRNFLIIGAILCSHLLSVGAHAADQNSPAFNRCVESIAFQPNIPYRTDSHFSEKNAKLLSKAQVSIDNENFKDAEKKLEVLEKRNLNDFEQALVYFLNGQIAAKRGMSGDAIEQYRRISSLNQNNIPLAFEREVDLAALQLHFKASSIDVIVSEVLSWCAKPATDKTVARNLLLNLYGQLGLQSEVEALNAVVPSGDYLPLVKIAPDYPLGAQQKGISGYCVIEYTVSKTGAVLDPQVVEGACEHARFFAEPSIEAAKQFKYAPHLIDGEAVEVEGVQNKFTYELLP